MPTPTSCLKRERSSRTGVCSRSLEDCRMNTESSPVVSKRRGKADRISPASCVMSPVACTGGNLMVTVLNEQGVEFFEKRQYSDAKESFNRALRVTEQDSLVLYVLQETSPKPFANRRGHENEDTSFGSGPITSALLAPPSTLESSGSLPSSSKQASRFKHRPEYDEGMVVFRRCVELNVELNVERYPRYNRLQESHTFLLHLPISAHCDWMKPL